ncbi:MAG: type II TA system antitoxin MqsA family protein [Chloroflexota bacterium]
MKKAYCPYCESFIEPYEETVEQTLPVRGESITVSGAVEHCPACKNALVSEQHDSATLERAYDVYRQRHGLLTPQEIRAIRESYGLSQRSLARLLGWGDITVHRYESGAIQDAAHDSLMRLIREPSNLLSLLEYAADRLPPEMLTKLKRRVEAQLEAERMSNLRRCMERVVAYPSSDEYSGYRALDLDKLFTVVLELTQRCGGLVKTKLNKMLWYCDFLHFRDFGASITGSPYLHLQYGPVPAHYDILVDLMELEGLLVRSERVFDAEKDIVGDVLSAAMVPDTNALGDSERGVVLSVVSRFGSFSARQISEVSHNERGYTETRDGQMISYTYARDLSP